VKAALDRQEPDQPTQDGGRVSAVSDTAVLQRAAEREKQARKTAERRQDGGLLDPYTLEWIARDCERRAEELCEAARENRQGCARGSYRDREANHLENEAHSLMKRAEYYRNLQTDQPAHLTGHGKYTPVTIRSRTITDQPADASEPSCCARTRAEERERCAQIADEDNPAYSKLDRYTADEIAAAIRRTGDTP
jgi:hypothetical protein